MEVAPRRKACTQCLIRRAWGAQINVKLNQENVDISHPPIVQSGGTYDLRPSAVNDERPLQYDVILLAIGANIQILALLC